MALDAAHVDRVRHWLAGAAAGLAWLTGAPGSGMTTMVAGLVAGLGMEAVWLTPSTMGTRAFLREVCSSPLAVNGKRKVLVLDELDVVLGNDAAMVEVAFVAKQNRHVPVVCILKSTRAAVGCDLQKKAALVVHFPPPTQEAMEAAVLGVAAEEGLDVADARRLCALAPGDIRHVLQTLRASMTETRTMGMQTADAVATLLEVPRTVEQALALFSADAGGIPNGLHETYLRTSDDIRACTSYADFASVGDVVDECIHAKQRWDLLDLYGVMTTCSAAVVLPRKADVRLDKYGTLWNKSYVQCSKAKLLRHVGLARMQHGLGHLTVQDLGYVRRMLDVKAVEELAERCRSAGLDAQACLNVMRLWDTGYKLSTHNRLKRVL